MNTPSPFFPQHAHTLCWSSPTFIGAPQLPRISCLFVLLLPELGVTVCHKDGQLASSLNKIAPLLRRNSSGDLSAVTLVGHHQHFQLLHVGDGHLTESILQHVTGFLVRSVTAVRHEVLTLEATTNSVVDTLGLTPFLLEDKEHLVNGMQWGVCSFNSFPESGDIVYL